MKAAVVGLGVFVLSLEGGQAQSLAELHKSFMERYDALNSQRDEKVRRLDGGYMKSLRDGMEKSKAAGDLDGAMVLREEIENIEAGGTPLPEPAEGGDERIDRLRGIYRDEHEKIITEQAASLVRLADGMMELLDEKEDELTKAGELELAMAARKMGATLAADQGIGEARAQIAASPDERHFGRALPGSCPPWGKGEITVHPLKIRQLIGENDSADPRPHYWIDGNQGKGRIIMSFDVRQLRHPMVEVEEWFLLLNIARSRNSNSSGRFVVRLVETNEVIGTFGPARKAAALRIPLTSCKLDRLRKIEIAVTGRSNDGLRLVGSKPDSPRLLLKVGRRR